MSERQQRDDIFAFTVVEEDGDDVTIEVLEADYQREKAAGLDESVMLKPGRYRLKRGGFLKRHPEMKVKERKSA